MVTTMLFVELADIRDLQFIDSGIALDIQSSPRGGVPASSSDPMHHQTTPTLMQHIT